MRSEVFKVDLMIPYTDLNTPPSSTRLRFKPLQSVDIFWLSTLISRPQVRELMLGSRLGGLREAGEIIQTSTYLNQSQPGLGFWKAIDEKQYGVGIFSLLPGESAQVFDMGVQLHPDYWGKWYGVEGGKLLAQHAFDTLELNAVYAHTHPGNLAAQAIARRVGFVDDGIAEYQGNPAARMMLQRDRYLKLAWRQHRLRHALSANTPLDATAEA